jgi:hypothetical protein
MVCLTSKMMLSKASIFLGEFFSLIPIFLPHTSNLEIAIERHNIYEKIQVRILK